MSSISVDEVRNFSIYTRIKMEIGASFRKFIIETVGERQVAITVVLLRPALFSRRASNTIGGTVSETGSACFTYYVVIGVRAGSTLI